jgi:hypothetical protein
MGLLALLTVAAVLIGPLSVAHAASQPYIRINNGTTLSITRTEQPQVVVQFGNQGDRINDARVVCTWNNLIRFNGQVQLGPFPSAEFVAPTVNDPPLLFYPQRSVVNAGLLPDLSQGQNYNVGFGIRLEVPSQSFTGAAGSIRCSLLNANFAVLAQSSELAVIVR